MYIGDDVSLEERARYCGTHSPVSPVGYEGIAASGSGLSELVRGYMAGTVLPVPIAHFLAQTSPLLHERLKPNPQVEMLERFYQEDRTLEKVLFKYRHELAGLDPATSYTLVCVLRDVYRRSNGVSPELIRDRLGLTVDGFLKNLTEQRLQPLIAIDFYLDPKDIESIEQIVLAQNSRN
ncbi:hypothetical protein DRJ48_02645 [Candidatus Woesearchaeota archaeon]|nr:hypothetical protein [Candidatus Woesearchaeota archaeon]RLE42816.1 MAG: hypothetical protein DRJ48_02645 [Candidatus Woesearchaeota archaeon]